MSPFWTFCARAPSGFKYEWTYSAWECSALRDVHIVLDTNKTYPKRRDYLFSFNLNLNLFTLALENLYFNTLDREKVQGKSVGCIKSRGDTSPTYCTPTLQGATAEGWKSRMRLGSRGLPTPALYQPYTYPTPYRKFSAISDFQHTLFCVIYKLFEKWGHGVMSWKVTFSL